MAGNNFIASLDIGTDKVALLVSEIEDNGHQKIIAHNICSSDGVRKGSIHSIEALSRTLLKLVNQTENSYSLNMGLFRVNLSDSHLTCTDGKGKIPIDGMITKNDYDLVRKTATAMSTPTNKLKLHTINKKFIINETFVVDDPIEMEAEVLESKVHIVTVSSASVRNIENCLKQSNLEVDDIVLNPIAKSNALLSQDDKDNGVCILDIGAGVTSYSVFNDEGIIRSGIIPMGGDEINQEIAYAFDTSIDEAKRLKEKYGVAKSSTLKEDSFINFNQVTNQEDHQLSCLQLSEVIEEAYKEILLLLKNELKFYNLDGIIKSGFILSGGGSEINSLEELVRDYFTRRVKKGMIQRSKISGLETVLTDYRYAGAIGLLLNSKDMNLSDLSITKGNKGVMDNIRDKIIGNF